MTTRRPSLRDAAEDAPTLMAGDAPTLMAGETAVGFARL
jgi:hypothetical protein